MKDYDIGKAFEAIENELIASMMRNMDKHRAQEDEEGIQWEQWQALQLKALEQYKKKNQTKYSGQFKGINKQIDVLLREARQKGNMQQEITILNAIKNGFKTEKISKGVAAEFFKINERKLDALIKATTQDMEKAETAVLRMADDQYRKIIFNAQVYANSGAGTYEKAVDMATKDFLSAGLNCIEYANGARHTLSDYADMAIRTASKRAYLQGEGEKRKEWGISTVIMNKRGNPCPKCLPFVGKILIDDVWSGGSQKDGKYPLMSSAIAAGLYHPRCKDSHTTYFEGISTLPDEKYTKNELQEIEENYKADQKVNYAKRQEEKFGRLAEYSLDAENQKRYSQKEKIWKHVRFRTGGLDKNEYIDTKDATKIVGFSDVTEEWINSATPNSKEIKDLTEYVVDDVTYKVDGKSVLLDYSNKEKEVAELLEKQLGGEMFMVPRILNPPGISTPDYIFRKENFDLKELSGTSKNLVYNAISKKKRQASNFILDASNCVLSEEEIHRQIDYVYWSRHTIFVKTIILIRDGKILRIFTRNN